MAHSANKYFISMVTHKKLKQKQIIIGMWDGKNEEVVSQFFKNTMNFVQQRFSSHGPITRQQKSQMNKPKICLESTKIFDHTKSIHLISDSQMDTIIIVKQ